MSKPTEKLASVELPLASEDAHEQLYDLLVTAASERVLAVDDDETDAQQEAA